jgi:thiosulfate/3-mercaptopyruvate sulfurtransferase
MRSRFLFVAAGAAIVVSGCGQEAAPPGESESAPATTGGTPAAPDLFVEAPAVGAQVVFVGRDSTVLRSDVAGAVFVPLSTFSVERDGIPNEFPPADDMTALLESAGLGAGPFVIVGEPIPAGRAFAALDYLGLGDRAALLDGGLAAVASITPAAGMRTDAAGAQLDIAVREDMIVDAAWVHARLDDPGVVILDARPPAEFSGETPGEGVDRPGHIPGARNVFWQTLVESPESPRLEDEAELRRIFREAGVDAGDIVVAYCRTGGQASFLYTVARHLGHDVKLYDGSFIDWSRTEYAVER